MITFFAATAFAVFAFLGTFIVNLDDTATREYDDSAFFNGAKDRIVVATANGEPMTQEDYQALLAVNHVVALEPNGYASDVQYAYRQNRDYVYRYTTLQYDAYGRPIGTGHDRDVDNDGVIRQITVDKDAPFLRTIPLLADGQTFLTAGRFPETIWEVVAVARPDQIGNWTTVYLTCPDRWGNSQLLTLVVQIVGVTDYDRGLYFHPDVGRICQQAVHMDKNEMIYIFMPNRDLDDHTFLCNLDLLEHFRVSGLYTQASGDITANFRNVNVADKTAPDAFVSLSLPRLLDKNASASEERAMQANQHQCAYVMEVSPANFQKLTWNTSSEQVSLTIADYAYTGRVLEKVQSMGYIAASVFQLGSTKIIDEKALERSQTLKICMMALIAIMLLQVILLRAMFANQTGDYKLLSNIGLTCSTAMRSICVQLVILAFAGQLLAGGAIWFCALQNVTRIVNVLVYLPIGYIALLLGIHDLVSVIGITWVLLSLKKQVYPLAGKETDLEMEETEVRVV